MASMLKSIFRLIANKTLQPGRTVTLADEENAVNANAGTNSGSAPATHLHRGNRGYLIPTDDPLTLFRLMVGIVTSEQLGFTEVGPVGKRPAANIGIYARVVHSEQNAKDSFKVFSAVVNGCYFFQIVVAAGLTAMSAGGAASGAITAFGAINTVIAGFLTFLKGSGLPGRLKYYGNEWKKIREYIEQRERDFARAGCTLNVYEVVETIEKMYANTKQDIELNTPDSYTSIGNQKQLAHHSDDRIGGIDVTRLEGITNKIMGLDGTVERLSANIHQRARDMTDNIHAHEKEIERDMHGLMEVGRQDLERARDHATRTGDEIVREAVSIPGRATVQAAEEVRAATAREIQKTAEKLDTQP